MTPPPGDHGLHLALEADGDGTHPAAWRFSGRPPRSVLGPRAVRQTVLAAEAAGFALVTFADSPLPPGAGLDAVGRLEAVARAAFVSTLTDRIGLAPTVHVTTTEPFHLATQLASLDFTSRGRAAWIVAAANDIDARATIGAAPLDAPRGLRSEITEVVEVARHLWDSWEDDAVIRDAITGRFLDADKVHHIDYEGTSFSIKGPLITPRPPQGQVVVVAPDDLGISHLVDVVLVSGPDPATVIRRAATARAAQGAQVFAEIEVLFDAAEAGVDRLAALDEATPWEHAGRLRHVGSAASLVHLLQRLVDDVDGVRLHPAVLSVDLPVLIGEVLPLLDAAGLQRRPRPGATLRSTLGLPRPVNRFASTTSTNV